MKASKILYKQVKNLGNYETKHVGIEVELHDGEKAIDAFLHAKRFVQYCLHHSDSEILTQLSTFNTLTDIILERRQKGEDTTDLEEIQEQLGFPFRDSETFGKVKEKHHTTSENFTGGPPPEGN